MLLSLYHAIDDGFPAAWLGISVMGRTWMVAHTNKTLTTAPPPPRTCVSVCVPFPVPNLQIKLLQVVLGQESFAQPRAGPRQLEL